MLHYVLFFIVECIYHCYFEFLCEVDILLRRKEAFEAFLDQVLYFVFLLKQEIKCLIFLVKCQRRAKPDARTRASMRPRLGLITDYLPHYGVGKSDTQK